jgi:putative hydrolase of the HAD superfamily
MSASSDYEAVLFDFGGVLSDGPFESFARYESENGLPEGFVRRLNTANRDTNAWARLERGEIDMDAFCDLFEDEARVAGGVLDARVLMSSLRGELRPRMLEAVRRCSTRFRTGLLTNNFVSVEGDETVAHVLELFDAVVESFAVGVRKPDPEFYSIACDRLGVEPGRCVFLDDLGVNLKPARAMGMTTIKVTDPDEAISDLEEILGMPMS